MTRHLQDDPSRKIGLPDLVTGGKISKSGDRLAMIQPRRRDSGRLDHGTSGMYNLGTQIGR